MHMNRPDKNRREAVMERGEFVAEGQMEIGPSQQFSWTGTIWENRW